MLSTITHVCGVDFSGAKDGERKIWIAVGFIKGNALHIEKCQSAAHLLRTPSNLHKCLESLRDFIKNQKGAAIGLDFPFGLPRTLVIEKTWEQFARRFDKHYRDADDFREGCHKVAGNAELRRWTDQDAHTPFSPYNLRLYKQTYYGISRLLGPLVEEDSVRVLPMQKPLRAKPRLVEICPASWL